MQKLRKKSRYSLIKPLDIILFIPLIFLFTRNSGTGNQVEILVDGNVKFIYSLNDERKIIIDGFIGTSVAEIKDGKVRMIDSPCRDKLCIKQGFICKKGENIICVPNRVVIKIRGEGIDGITE